MIVTCVKDIRAASKPEGGEHACVLIDDPPFGIHSTIAAVEHRGNLVDAP